jgi:hypothetical protein
MIDTGDDKKHWYLVHCKVKELSQYSTSSYIGDTDLTFPSAVPYINEHQINTIRHKAALKLNSKRACAIVITSVNYLGYMSEEYFKRG